MGNKIFMQYFLLKMTVLINISNFFKTQGPHIFSHCLSKCLNLVSLYFPKSRCQRVGWGLPGGKATTLLMLLLRVIACACSCWLCVGVTVILSAVATFAVTWQNKGDSGLRESSFPMNFD